MDILTVSLFLDTIDGILNPGHSSPYKNTNAEQRIIAFTTFLDTTNDWLKDYHCRVWEQLHKILKEWIGEYKTLKNLQIMNAAIQNACKPWRDEPEPDQNTKDILDMLKAWEQEHRLHI